MEDTALNHLKKIFSNTSSDTLSLLEVYQAAGRDLSKPIINRTWVGNRLTLFKKYTLAVPVYTWEKNARVLSGIKLTEKGKLALSYAKKSFASTSDYIEKPINFSYKKSSNDDTTVAFEEILKVLIKLSNEHPNLKIEYSLKDEVISVQYVQK